jgi:biotin carboxyl carrier protein
MKTYHIKLNGKVYEVEIEEVQGVSKEVVKTEVKNEVKHTSNGDGVKAPMPGTISKILVKEGQSVKKGEVLAILEAMKMENEIVSPKDGVVSSIDVSQGQNVNLNDSILKID